VTAPSRRPARWPAALAAAGVVALLLLGGLAGPAPASPDQGRPGSYCAVSGSTPPDHAWIIALYTRLLDRCPSPADLDHWAGRLAGGLSRYAVAEAVDRSDEGTAATIAAAYGKPLGRAATPDERARWTAHLRTARDDAALLAAVYGSDEYFELGSKRRAEDPSPRDEGLGTDEGWLDDMYQTLLARPPDEAGHAHFLASFGPAGSTSTTRARVVMAMLRSPEAARLAVRDGYLSDLDREPDPAGLAFWVDWLRGRSHWQTARFRSRLRSSDEGYALAGRIA